MDVLIEIKASSTLGQDAGFFTSDKDGFNMHFSTFQDVEGKRRIESWHSMQFRNDFTETLQKYGRLPISSYEK